MNTKARLSIGAVTLLVGADAMAGGGPHEPTWLVAGAGIGGVVGFLLGLWWCRRCHEKNKRDKGEGPNDR